MAKILILAGDGIGPEVMGETRKILDWVNQQEGLGLEFEEDLVGGSAFDAYGVPLHEKTLKLAQQADAVLADKGYDSDVIVHFVRRDMKAKAVIPSRRTRRVKRRHGKRLYKMRNLIERAFNKLKQWRRIATRYDRCDSTFAASIILAIIHIWV